MLYDCRLADTWFGGVGSPGVAHLLVSNINQNPSPPSFGILQTYIYFCLEFFLYVFFSIVTRQPNVQEFLELHFGPKYLKSKEVLCKDSSVLFWYECLNNVLHFFCPQWFGKEKTEKLGWSQRHSTFCITAMSLRHSHFLVFILKSELSRPQVMELWVCFF